MLAALTGGIGAGKSTVLNIFNELGAKTEDTDTVVHEIYENDKEVTELIKQRWGNHVFTNEAPDRKKIANVVFEDKNELKWLNSVMHPKVQNKISSLDNKGLTVIAVPLLYEVNWQSTFDKVVSVWCNVTQQFSRLSKRGWSNDEINSRMKAQMNQDEKLNRADYGIINNWTLPESEPAVPDNI